MSELASREQLRMSFVRWALVTVPGVLLLGLLAGASVPAGSDNGWYLALAKPGFTPPDWAFPVAWTILYILMGLALAIVLNARGARGRGVGIALFAAQLVANLAWNPLFFGWHHVLPAFGLIVVMFVLALAAAIVFGRIRAAAGWLLAPYLLWVAFAGLLTWSIHRLNPNADDLVPGAVSTQIDL